MKTKKCPECNSYTLEDKCPKCNAKTKDAHYKHKDKFVKD